ncbi:hypothetical protein F441_09428 [Phytophthora nicotianae CJ01A1]|uniref:Uncharacterized protein n=6 Tax=Phytophthora nicotianae TaxID=4792 RepID=W2Q4I0_PHYN3|nr:hypothetical protein PPTG_11968 [Phytophthora nicotianae INRA-310]ETI46108.1 hypothetical protein F443_09481 [Phytophthora nicotianae P1569]ETK86053.1 hypothetical protein L915_09292 [Phytophthora nicotianae]ETO74801.1 hypothetical protein F444_09551 [Phytophthora nicotianae P1976]ETP15922.1 hypothetical protein F441_09428 [Phytophthora nicotianae CJ01A1]ETP43975.1 hypothetical protein F442_09397 [Phytophthora nicotianae P10297]KUF81226.1 hypothetical protein AM587_10001128 [Phytophthora n
MPHALQHSFFPTAKELSSGVQWFKDHPVLAAAAATAVSVITYLNALELAEAEVEHVNDTPDTDTTTATRHRRPQPIRRKGSPSLSRKGSSGAASDGKLSAAVSWCDEHGGSLTQVFEDDSPPRSRRDRRMEESDSDDEARDDVAESCEGAFQQHRALTGGLRKSVTQQQLDATVGAAAVNDSDADTQQTESPQWGWYVPITPPQDQFQATSGRDSTVVASCSVQQPAEVNVKTMRRTTSGQIP